MAISVRNIAVLHSLLVMVLLTGLFAAGDRTAVCFPEAAEPGLTTDGLATAPTDGVLAPAEVLPDRDGTCAKDGSAHVVDATDDLPALEPDSTGQTLASVTHRCGVSREVFRFGSPRAP